MPVARQHALAIDPHANTVDAADLEPRGARVRALDARRGVCDAAIAVPRGRVEPDPVAPGAVLTPFELAAVRTLLLDLGPRGGFTTGDVEAVTHEIAAERARDLPAADVTDVVALPGLTHLVLESRRRWGARQDRRERRGRLNPFHRRVPVRMPVIETAQPCVWLRIG